MNECNQSPCSSNEQCQNIRGSYRCTCRRGYKRVGSTCQGNAKPKAKGLWTISGMFQHRIASACKADKPCLLYTVTEIDKDYNHAYLNNMHKRLRARWSCSAVDIFHNDVKRG